MSRSFNGCKRCKARRQKCDEQRPSCGRCMTAGTQCRYAMQLQWGGRAFSRSRFGACVGTGGMQKLEYSPGEFIYTTNASGTLSPGITTPPITTNTTLIRPIDPFASLTTDQKSLLHHFLNDASQITACHSGMQRDICKMLVPMALQTPSLLYATMALSAIHLQALHNQSENVKSAPEIARFMALSLEHFRQELQNPASKGSDALLATARTLCLAEIHSGAIHPNSWRAHIEGARALMEASDNCGALSPKSPEGFRRYLDRWYRSIVSLTALTGNGPPIGEVTDQLVGASNEGSSSSSQPASPDYLDDYWGFTVNLSAIFRRIGAVAWREQQEERGQESPVQGNEVCVHSEATALESSLRQLMEQDVASQPAFYPGVVEGLSAECMRQLMLCNEAFQLSALIQIQRRLRKVPTSAPVVQEAVKRILECTAQIGPSPGLSPWVMLTTPLFIAGCEAREDDREQVRQLLSSLHDTIRVPNVLQSLKFLEQYWSNQLNENEGWSQFLDTSAAAFVDEDDDDSPNGPAYTAQFSNGTPLHSRLVSEPFIPVLRSPPVISKRATTMALHLPSNRPPPLHIESPRRGSGMSDSKQPKTPANKISSFFGWRGSTSPGAESSSTEISETGRSPVPSPMPPSLPSASFSITPSTTVPFDSSKPQVPVPQRNPSLSSASLLDPGSATLVTELENELREISSELAGSIRREMELEDLVERLQSDVPLDTPNRPTSDYFSDSGSSSIRYAHESGGRIEDIGKFKRTAEQERAQIKTELSQKVQEERSRRAASEAHVQILESQVHQLRRERVDLSDMSSRTKELETALEATRRKLAEERQIKDNFEDLLTAMRVELEQLRNERDHLRDNVIPQMQQAGPLGAPSSDPSEVERLLGEIEALKIENASLAQLQGSRFASIAEEDGMSTSRNVGLGLSRSNSLARLRTKNSAPNLSRSGSLSRSNSTSAKDRGDTPKESLADRIKDVEEQRDALHQSLRRLLDRQAHDSREYEKRLQLMELEVARAQQASSPRKLGYERDVHNLRDEVNLLRQRAEDALEQKWQCEKGLAGLKMDLDRAEQETTSLRVLLQEHDITVPEDLECDRDGFAEVLATSSSLDSAYRQLQADREIAEASSPMTEQGPLAESVSRTKMLAQHVQRQLAHNNALRSRLAEAIGKGEREQQVSAIRINEMQARLKEMEDILLIAQQYSEEEIARHEEEVRALEESHNAQLKRMKNGSRSPATLSPMPPNTPFDARSPRLDFTTSGKGMPLEGAVQSETLARRVKELEKLLREADLEMGEVVSRMNRAQIEVGELQSDRDEALRLTRKLQAEIMAERETFKTLMA
ncbi:hypothetical protein BO70DRAFT_337157 [Aspergillus heteromorphus CBS 117.55]|uniref:Zn(2)-C6 fungal-type domain-containing protein n=1 Tax=Aspergillus heteromorphus CBS 117.55 TaxID=1448321 RepID=A0A317W7W1_9EURO|nr:uncharacterized protein BO70DRAFT_337157 [Aspergillus heteromorphus CBS 117.55]PWY81975.1 hypothetical protein BO70DRAFT_337157 [Aspergillus heteromorphus CBS 117.55]